MFHLSSLPRFDLYRPAMQTLKELSEVDFLGGPGRPTEDIIIDPIFASPLNQVLTDCYLPAQINQPGPEEHLLLSRDSVIYRTAVSSQAYDVGVIALDQDGHIIGAYTGCCLAVDPPHTSRGIATCLVMLRYLEDDSLPLWDHDKPGFTPAGHAVHIRAFHELLSSA